MDPASVLQAAAAAVASGVVQGAVAATGAGAALLVVGEGVKRVCGAVSRSGGGREPTYDEKCGMAWWNGMSAGERAGVMRDAQALKSGASVADAYGFWREGKVGHRPGR